MSKDILEIPFQKEEEAFGVCNISDWTKMSRAELLNYILVITAQRNEYRRRLEHVIQELYGLRNDITPNEENNSKKTL